ncbi:3-dehydroquinate synthase [Nonlabens marinus]|uniref:3-dehydroquinate synthase n=1 Tax=Nonlabens marinus S1-08 TaxID=1454201 RepID=W8VSI8_9FLAO|nr:3-dehydroquinate synthase [Nonlabens marinus]BAO56235.1 3-dehydroquinate synthase [Nonlabens marinus S1-08]
MTSIINENYAIHFGDECYRALNEFIAVKKPSTVFVLVDENTMEHCYAPFAAKLETVAPIEVIEIDAGEEFKNIDTCSGVWNALIELNCDRNSLFISLGGGVVTDLGGFVAATIKRGIDFIHVPTSLLAMVDASIGGKNGVDLGPLKNQVGVIQPPVMTLVDPKFLSTLPEQQLRNGSIEMFKHGLIADRAYWENMLELDFDFSSDTFESLIYQSIIIKNDVVLSDPFEKDARKSLNYGHTVGHAIESYCMSNPKQQEELLHGEAVAAGIIIESYLSQLNTGLSKKDLKQIEEFYEALELGLKFSASDVEQIIGFMAHDKKNVNGEVRFVLLNAIGSYQTDCVVDVQEIRNGFKLYLS